MRTVDELARQGFLERVKVLGATRFRESNVAYLVKHGTGGSPERRAA